MKPENLFITADGRIKILDCGVAKLTRPTENDSDHPCVHTETQPGVVVGTAAYLSPEQVRGERLDARSETRRVAAIRCSWQTALVPTPE